MWRVVILFAFLAGTTAARNPGANKPPVIRHDPVVVAAPGEPLVIRATVTDDSGVVGSVSLRYSPSRDVAPFRIPMQEVAPGVYLGLIPATMLKGVKEISYYLEAVDSADAISETPWHTVSFRPAAEEEPRSPSATIGSPIAPKRKNLKTAAWVGGGVLGGVAAGLIGADLLQDEKPNSAASPAVTNFVGTYVGQATISLEFPGSPPRTETHAISITIFENGVVRSDNLHPGRHLETRLVDNTFNMTVPVTETNLNGEIRYTGTVWSGRISGMARGSVVRTDTLPPVAGIYSGTFYAIRP